MNKFKTLATEAALNTHDMMEFLIDHGINPSVVYSHLRLYDPSTKGLIVVRGPVKTSPYFTAAKKDEPRQVSPDDALEIVDIEEKRIPEGNFYVVDNGTKRTISVDDFIKDIYNNPKNEMLIYDLGKNNPDLSLDTTEKRDIVKQQLNKAEIDKQTKEQAAFEKWVDDYEYLFGLNDLSDKVREEVLKKLYKKAKEGFAAKDLLNFPIVWIAKHDIPLSIYKRKIDAIPDADERKIINTLFNRQCAEWYKQSKENKALNDDRIILKLAMDWWKEISKKLDENTLEEADTSKVSTKDAHLIKDVYLPKIGIDPKFYTVPITELSYYNKEKYKSAKDDPNGKRGHKFTIVGIPDITKLSDNDSLWVKEYESDERPYLMNIGEIKELVNQPQNIDAELDTVKYRTLDLRNARKTLNAGIGRFEILPDAVIETMLSTVNNEYPDEFPVDLIEYFHRSQNENYKPLLKGHKDLVLTALRKYNDPNLRSYIIERFDNKGKVGYRGFVPYPGYENLKPTKPGKDDFSKLIG